MKKRCIALFLAVIVAFGGIGLRPQKAYASPTLAVPACEILYTLLLSAGFVIASGADHETKIQATRTFYDSLDFAGRNAITLILESATVVGGTLYQWTDGFERSRLVELWNSVFSAAEQYKPLEYDIGGDFTPVSSVIGATSTYFTAPAGAPAYAVFDMRNYFLVFATLSDGRIVSYKTNTLGTGINQVVYYSGSLRLDVFGSEYFSKDENLFLDIDNLLLYVGERNIGNLYCTTNGINATGYRFFYDGILYGRGSCSLDSLSFWEGITVGMDELIDCDTWADTVGRTADIDKKVGILTGQDLSGFNTLDDAYTGLITGVLNPDVANPDIPLDPPLNPDIPLDPPATGDLTGISGLLKKIWEWLQGCLDKFIAALSALFAFLFVPTAAEFQASFDPFLFRMQSHFDLDAYRELLEGFETLKSPYAPNITAEILGNTYTVVDFSFFNKYRETFFTWTRGVFFALMFIYNLNFIYQVIRGASLTNGSGSNPSSGSGSKPDSGKPNVDFDSL